MVRSAIAPETMVAVVARKTKLKTKAADPVKPPEGLVIKDLKSVHISRRGIPANPQRSHAEQQITIGGEGPVFLCGQGLGFVCRGPK